MSMVLNLSLEIRRLINNGNLMMINVLLVNRCYIGSPLMSVRRSRGVSRVF